jgi:hypothetical protein
MVMSHQGPKLLTKEEQYKLFGLGRVQINDQVKLYSWKSFKTISGGKIKLLRKMEESGKMLGAHAEHWYCSFIDIGAEYWISVEYWDGDRWVEYV